MAAVELHIQILVALKTLRTGMLLGYKSIRLKKPLARHPDMKAKVRVEYVVS